MVCFGISGIRLARKQNKASWQRGRNSTGDKKVSSNDEQSLDDAAKALRHFAVQGAYSTGVIWGQFNKAFRSVIYKCICVAIVLES